MLTRELLERKFDFFGDLNTTEYRYTGNNPLIRKDPNGKDWRWLLIGGAIIAIWIANDLSDPDNSEIIGTYNAAKQGCEEAKRKFDQFKEDSKKKWDNFWKDKKEPEFKPDPTEDTNQEDPNKGNLNNQPPNRHLM